MFDLWSYLGYLGRYWDLGNCYEPKRALTANQIRVRKIKRKVQARKMLNSKRGKRRSK